MQNNEVTEDQPEPSKRIRAAEYVRMSTEHQQYSTENQADKIREYARVQGIEIVRTYADDGKSGLNIGGRKSLQQLLGDVDAGAIDFKLVLVYDVSRWGRFQDPDEAAYYEHLLKRKGVHVRYVAEQFDNDGSPVSTIVKGVKRAMAGEYSRELSAKVFAGQCRLIELGFRQGGPAGFGLRRWFHYSHSGWLPAKFRFWARKDAGNTPELDTYLNHLAALADRVVEQQDVNLIFFPMHVGGGEDDPEFARQVVARMNHGERTCVIAGDDISPDDYLALIGHAKFFVASRLHSAILATVANVPAICLYYVDKGRLFFEQVGLQRFSRDIKVMQQPGIVDELAGLVAQLVTEGEAVKAQQLAALESMRGQIRDDFVAGIAAAKLKNLDVEGHEHQLQAERDEKRHRKAERDAAERAAEREAGN